MRAVSALEIHGVPYADLSVELDDGVVASGRLGVESIPVDLEVGERVLVRLAMNVMLAVRRP